MSSGRAEAVETGARRGARVEPFRSGGLRPWSRRIVEALADATCPPGRLLTLPAGPIAGKRLDGFFAEVPGLIRFAFLCALVLLEWSALFISGGRFSRLDRERRLRVLERWHHGSFGPRVALRFMLTPIKIAYFAEPEVSRALGYEPKRYAPKAGALDELPPGDIRFGKEQRAPQRLRCDAVVVGSGAGGAVVACELARAGHKVVLVEEGEYWTRPMFNGRSYEMSRHLYRDFGLTVGLGRPGIPIPLGKTVGGTTTINSGTCFRVPDRVLAHWRGELGLTEFTQESLVSYYERVERALRVQPVSDAVLGPNAQIVARGARALGLHGKPLPRNADGCEGSGVCCFGCPEDAKRSTNLSFIPDALAAGTTLYTGTLARRVLFEGPRAIGLLCEMGPQRQPLRIDADAVVVAAGAIHTPAFLKSQGLGRRSRALGRYLSIHPATKVYALMPEPVHGWHGVPQGYYIDDFAEQGLMLEGAFLPPDYGSIGFPFFGPRLTECMERYDHLASFGFLIEDASRGSVRRGPDGRPLILYDLGREDVARVKKGVELLCRIFFEAGAAEVFPPLAQLPELRRPEDVAQIAKLEIRPEDLEMTAFHPLGTCRIGRDSRSGVIDPDCEAYEKERLFVVDGSIFPSSLGVNPQLTIMAFAARAAERIGARLGGAPRRYAA